MSNESVLPEPEAAQMPVASPSAVPAPPGLRQPGQLSQLSETVAVAGPPTENVGRGLLFAVGALPVAMVLSALVWKLGFVASIVSFALAAGVVWLYVRGAGTTPRKGLVPVVLLIIVGVALAFLGNMAVDASDYWSANGGPGSGVSRTSFIFDNIFRPEVISSYGKELAFYVGFAALGTFSTIRRLFK
jgi:hypothetical protein